MITCYLEETLQNPDSLKGFEIQKEPEIVTLDTYYGFIPLYEGQKVWEVFIVYDVRNENGQYIGPDLHVVWIRHNRIVAFDYKEIGLAYRVEHRLEGTCAPGESPEEKQTD